MTYKLCLPADQARIAAEQILSANPPGFVIPLVINHALGKVADDSVANSAAILSMGRSTLSRHVGMGTVPAYKNPKGEYRVQRILA